MCIRDRKNIARVFYSLRSFLEDFLEKNNIFFKSMSCINSKSLICSDLLTISLQLLLTSEGTYSVQKVYRNCQIANCLILYGVDNMTLVERIYQNLSLLGETIQQKDNKFKLLKERIDRKEKKNEYQKKIKLKNNTTTTISKKKCT